MKKHSGSLLFQKPIKIKKNKVFMELNEELSEFTGALIGDGCLSKYYSNNRERYEIAFTGSIKEYEYYKKFLQPTLQKNFGTKGRLFTRKNSTRFHIVNKKVFEFFSTLGIPTGKKGTQLKIPEKLLKKEKNAKATIRGIMNTDGSVYRRYKKKYNKHPKVYKHLVIQLKLISKKVVKQVKEQLEKQGIKCTKITKIKNPPHKNAFVLRITNQIEIKKYLKKIGFSNKYYNKRIKLLMQ